MILWFNTCWAQLGSSSLGWIYSCVWGQVLGQSSAPGAEMAHFCSTQSPILHQVNSGLFSWRRQGSLKTAKACQGLLRPQLTRAGEIGLPLGWRCCKVAEGTAVRITSAVFEKKKNFQSSSQEQYQLAFNAWHIMQGQWLCSPFTILLAIILKAIQILTNTAGYCWAERHRLSDISPAKMALFKISRELQFEICNHGEPYHITAQ